MPTTQTTATPSTEGVGDISGADLQRLLATAIRKITSHVNNGGLCAVCGGAFPCQQAVVAEHNLALL
jgi:hypothetical protein